jgi:hypothetical protein
MANRITFPIGYYPDNTQFGTIALGDLYIGNVDTDPTVGANQKTVTAVQEDTTTVGISQPVSLSAGGTPTYAGSDAELFVDGAFSMAILDSSGSQIYYVADASLSSSGVLYDYDDTGIEERTVEERLRDIISVKDYGAVGDGATDDTTNIQAAMTAVAALNKSLYFPAGQYLCTAALTLSNGAGEGINIIGAGQGVAEIIWNSASSGIQIVIDDAREHGTTVIKDISLRAKTLACTGPALSIVASAGGAGSNYNTGVEITNVNISTFIGGDIETAYWASGIFLEEEKNCKLSNVYCTGRSLTQGVTGNGLELAGFSVETIISDCTFYSWNKAITFSEGADDDGEGVKVINCAMVNVGYGVYIDHSTPGAQPWLDITDTHINATKGCVYLDEVGQIAITNNLLYAHGDAETGFVGVYSETSTAGVISGNIFINLDDTFTNFTCIDLPGCLKYNISDNVAHNSAAVNAWNVGLNVDTTNQDINARNNNFLSCTTPMVNTGPDKTIYWQGLKAGMSATLIAPGTQDIVTATPTEIDWSDYDADDSTLAKDDVWAAGNPERFVVPAGVTRVRMSASVFLEAGGAGSTTVKLFRGGAGDAGMPWVVTSQSVTDYTTLVSSIITVTPGQYFSLELTQDSGSNKMVQAVTSRTWFNMEIIA